MTRGLVSIAALLSLGACVTEGTGISIFTPKPDTAEEALELYYDTIPDSALPTAGEGAAFPAPDAVINTILIGSCLDEEKGPSAAMTSIANEEADLFLMVGDNVYGDRDGRAYVNNQADLDELRESFADLAAREDFQSVRSRSSDDGGVG